MACFINLVKIVWLIPCCALLWLAKSWDDALRWPPFLVGNVGRRIGRRRPPIPLPSVPGWLRKASWGRVNRCAAHPILSLGISLFLPRRILPTSRKGAFCDEAAQPWAVAKHGLISPMPYPIVVKNIYGDTVGIVLPCQTTPFAAPKVWFCRLKRMVSQSETVRISNLLDNRWLECCVVFG